jgi:ATP-dependent RNA helicase DHX57
MVNRRSGTKPAVNKATDATEPAAKRSARAPDAPVQNKPTAKQLVGGSSWTGKIPTTLLQEYCQKQGWARCDYAIAKTGQLFAVRHVLLSKKNPKNNEVTNISLRPTPETAAVLPDKGSPLEARNVAAIFALHRIASDRSWLMQLPPEYRDIWKALVVCKQADDKANKSWMYASDPFRTAKEHELQKEAWVREAAKRGEELRKTGHQAPKPSFDWQRAPTVEMSRDFRQRIETMVRGTQLSLSQKEILTPEQRHKIIASLVQIGFRQSHAIEALENCSAQEDALEW